MPFKRIALIGATGAVGRHILTALLKSFPATSLTVLTRQSSIPPKLPAGVKLIALPSYTDHDTVVAALKGHDVLISALSATALDLEPRIVELAIEARVQRFIPSEFTMDVLDATYQKSAKTPIARQRVEWAEKLEQIAAEGRIEHTTIVPGPFVDYCLETGFWPFDIEGKKATLYDGGEVRRTGCSLKFAGECVAAALSSGEVETKNERVRISEVEYTGKAILEVLEKETGKEWKVEQKPSSDLLREEDDLIEKGNSTEAYFAFVVRGNFDQGSAGLLLNGFDRFKEQGLNVFRRSLVDVIKDVIKESTAEQG